MRLRNPIVRSILYLGDKVEARLGHLYARFKAALDDLCRVSSRTLRANIACIVQCNKMRARVIGSTGTSAKELSGNTAFPAIEPNQFHIVKELQQEEWFHQNCLASIAATASRLLVVRLDVQLEEVFYLVVFDPANAQLKDTAALASISEVARIAASFVNQAVILSQLQETAAQEGDSGFQERRVREPEVFVQASDRLHPLVDFLIRSLVAKRSLRTRKGFAYVSLRTWRAGAKDAQLDALKVLKGAATGRAIKPIALEMAGEIRTLYAGISFEAVVCVPCGHSQPGYCFSELLAQEVASVLGLKFVAALRGQRRKGSSHPKNSARLGDFEVVHPVQGPVLLVDDVATSGIHMQKAMSALRESGCFPLAIAWIGS